MRELKLGSWKAFLLCLGAAAMLALGAAADADAKSPKPKTKIKYSADGTRYFCEYKKTNQSYYAKRKAKWKYKYKYICRKMD